VSISGVTIVVGAPEENSNATGVNGDQNNNGASNSGAAYLFVRDEITWTQKGYLKAVTIPSKNLQSVAVDEYVVAGQWENDVVTVFSKEILDTTSGTTTTSVTSATIHLLQLQMAPSEHQLLQVWLPRELQVPQRV
jgi:hypothetical protein